MSRFNTFFNPRVIPCPNRYESVDSDTIMVDATDHCTTKDLIDKFLRGERIPSSKQGGYDYTDDADIDAVPDRDWETDS